MRWDATFLWRLYLTSDKLMNSTVVTLKRKKKKNEKVPGKQWIGEDGIAELILSVPHVSLII